MYTNNIEHNLQDLGHIHGMQGRSIPERIMHLPDARLFGIYLDAYELAYEKTANTVNHRSLQKTA